MATTYINKGLVKCKETGKVYENVKLMEITEDGETLMWNENLKRYTKWEAAE